MVMSSENANSKPLAIFATPLGDAEPFDGPHSLMSLVASGARRTFGRTSVSAKRPIADLGGKDVHKLCGANRPVAGLTDARPRNSAWRRARDRPLARSTP